MPDWLKFPVVLVIVSLISAVSLAYVQNLTEPARKVEAERVKKEALAVVLPDAKDFKEMTGKVDGKDFEYFKGVGGNGELLGYASAAEAYGYSSFIRVMVGVDKEFKIVAMTVISHKETPGLGDKVNQILSQNTLVNMIRGIRYDETGLRPWFQVQFDGKTVPIKVQKDGGTIEAITGATISSRAVCKAVDAAITSLEAALKNAQ